MARRRGGRRARRLRRDARAGSLAYFGPVAEDAGLSARARAHAAGTAPGRRPRAAAGAAAARRPGPRRSAGALRSVVSPRRRAADRAELFRAAARAIATRRRPPTSSCCSICRSTMPPSASSSSALVGSARSTLATVPHGDHDAIAYLDAHRRRRRGALTSARQGRPRLPAPVSLQRRRAAGGACARRLARVLLGARRRARVRRDRAAHPARGARRRALRRDGDPRALAAQLLRPARARAAPRRRAGVVRPRHAAAASGRAARSSRCSRARPSSCRRRASPSTCRSARCRAASTRRWRRTWVASRDEAVESQRRRADDDESRRTSRSGAWPPNAAQTPTRRRRRHAARAVAVGAAARRGGGDRPGRRALAAAARRQGEGARAAEEGSRGATEAATAQGRRGLEHVLEQLDHLRAFALPIIEQLAAWPRAGARGASGSIGSSALAPRVLRTPAHVLRVLADLRPMADVGPVDLDEARRVLAERLLTARSRAAGAPLRPRVRRHAAAGARPQLPRRVRARPRRADVSAEAARGSAAARRPARGGRRGAADAARSGCEPSGCCCSSRSAPRRERLYVSYPRIELSEVAGARAVVLRARRHARGDRPRAAITSCSRSGRARPAMRRWPGRRRRDPTTRSTIRSTTWRCCAGCSTSRDRGAVKGHAHYLLKLNECLRRSVVERWARGERRWSPSDGLTRVTPHTQAALAAQRLTARAVLAVGAAEVQRLSVPVRAGGDLPAAAAREPEPLQRMDPLTRGSLFHEIQARFFDAAASARRAAGDGRRPSTRRGATLDDVVDAVAGTLARRAGAGRRARLGRRDRVDPPRPARLARSPRARRRASGCRRYFEFGFGAVPGERDAASRARAR